MELEVIQGIEKLLKTSKKIIIIPHRNPDGDAMGSTLALYHFLLKNNHKVTVLSPNEFPDFLAWLPGAETVKIFENDIEKGTELLKTAEIIFTLDFNALHRTGEKMEAFLNQLKTTFLMIDHHQKPDNYAKYTYSNPSFSSTCEMVYNFISLLGKKSFLDKNIATCIYTGILTDTGGFRYYGTTNKTHEIVAELIALGVENSKIPSLLYDNSSYNRLQLLGRTLQNMKLFEEHHTSYSTLTQRELDEFHFEKGDTEGFVNYGLSIRGIVFTAIFIENAKENTIKISFRSQGNFDVNEFARNYFDGGGHKNAAGGKSLLTMQETIQKFEALIKKIKIEL